MGGKSEALKEIFTSRNLGSTERSRRNENKEQYLEILYVLVSPPLSDTSFYPTFLTKEKAQQSRPDQNSPGSRGNEVNMELGRDKGSILTCPALYLNQMHSGPTAMILTDDGCVRGIGYCQRGNGEAIMIGFGKGDTIDQFMANS